MRRRSRLILALLALTLASSTALSGCSIRNPTQTPLEEAVPAALLSLDIGITEAEATTTTSGFAVGVTAWVTVDRATMTADDLRNILDVLVDNTAISNLRTVSVGAIDGTSADSSSIDLSSVGEELGFAPSSDGPGKFTADWDDVVSFLDR
ncbi:MAG: hypothetical protein ACOH1T_02980 [Microbacteriaceae bacterium]